LRGRALAGFAPGALRLEALAPFGSPAFILVADESRGTLLLPRDHRILQNVAPEDILNALIGVPLGPDDLRAVLSGCVKANAMPKSGRELGPDWMSIDLDPRGTLYLHRVQGPPATWRVVAGRYSDLEIEYPQFAGEQPVQIVIRSELVAGVAGSIDRAVRNVDLTIGVSQVEVNGDLPRDQLVAVKIPPGLQPITLAQLRDAGPLGR
jgi:hypothetical protein